MTYFVSNATEREAQTEPADVRANAGTLTGADTEAVSPNIPGGGTYWWRIAAPTAGAAISALSDVTVWDIGGGNVSLVNATAGMTMTLYQAQTMLTGDVGLTINSTSSTIPDAVLAAKYPTNGTPEGFSRLVVQPGGSGNGYLNEFYLAVSVDSSTVAQVYGSAGVAVANLGRFLVTAGSVTGARDAAWGNWLDTVTTGTPTTPTTPTAPTAPTTFATPANEATALGAPGTAMNADGADNTYQPFTVDEKTGTFRDASGAVVADLTNQVAALVKSGLTTAAAIVKVSGDVGASAAIDGTSVYLQAAGPEALGTIASYYDQVSTSMSVKDALRTYYSDLMGILTDELKAFDGGQQIDVDARINAAGANLATNAGLAFGGPIGSAAGKIKDALGLNVGNSQPVIDVYLKTADDAAPTTLAAGHSDRYIGTGYADKVQIGANGIAYGGGGNDVLLGGVGGGDVLNGGSGDDTLIANSKNNTLIGGSGHNHLIGGTGIDTAYYEMARSAATIAANGDGSYTVTTPVAVDTLTGIDVVAFNDGTKVQVNANTVGIPPVYRFFDKGTGTHFFTSDVSERNAILVGRADYAEETNDFGAANPVEKAGIPVYRFFDTIHGTHFFTASASEANSVKANRPDLTYEASSTFFEHATQLSNDVAVYRFFDQTFGTHFYTGSQAEHDGLVTKGTASYRADLVDEGVSFYAPSGKFA